MHTLTIDVKPYVAKYVLARYGLTGHPSPVWEINKSDRVGKVVYSLLEHTPKLYKLPNLKLGAKLTIAICAEYGARRGLWLTADSIKEFNDYIHRQLIEEVAMYVHQVKTRVGLKKYREIYVVHNLQKSSRTHVVRNPDLFQYLEQKEIIYDTLKLYGITEDDLPFETVRKACQRFKLPMLIAC